MAFDWKKTLGTVAPGIATMLGGPLAGMAITAVMGGLGIKSTGDLSQDEELLSQKVQGMTPADAIKLKEIETSLAIEMKKAGVDIFRIEVADRESARKRERDVGSLMVNILAFIIVGAFIAVVWRVLFSGATIESVLAGTLIGYLSAKTEQVVAYFFGSSKGSKEKTTLLGKTIKTN